MSRRITRSMKQGQIFDHFSNSRIVSSEKPETSLKEKIAPSSSRVQLQYSQVEETIHVQKGISDEKSRPAPSLRPLKKVEKVKKMNDYGAVVKPHLGIEEFFKLCDTVADLRIKEDIPESPNKSTTGERESTVAKESKEAPKHLSVLARIQARNAAKIAAEKRRNPELEAKIADLRRLVDERNLYLIFNAYQSSSRTSICTTKLVDEMAESKTGITRDLAPSLLTRLTSLVPAHFSIENSTIGKFMRVSPDNSPETFTTVESLLKKEKAVCLRQTTTPRSSLAMRGM